MGMHGASWIGEVGLSHWGGLDGGGVNEKVPDFNKLPYSLLSQGDD